ncbi:hypothetical protein Theco_3830 [Thermobacillus composti KWC4]|uniref:Uncharacterized protein n=1 Tax=Thermobacillus composti (strain DSM 18247 / JCM 13945 / KWC4) TaxID=717605 RepID=L0EJD9_THECK|nr:DUF5693 family protein [Thermobacillus composti]AGA59841.1 hypothetical protein Theco_3830 [Thermobacillus composti KWC4]
MPQAYRFWNRAARRLLLVLTALGVLAALPLGFVRHQMEQKSKTVEFVFDYRDLLLVASYQAHPQQFMEEKLAQLKEAGVTTLAVFEGSLDDFARAGRITVYNSMQAALLQGEPAPADENYTYVLFADEKAAEALEPLFRRAFEASGNAVRTWSFGGKPGLVLETSVEDAQLRPMEPDPLTLEELAAAGFRLLPRLTDRIRPYDPDLMDEMLGRFAELGVERLLFEGTEATGFGDQAQMQSLDHFASLLNKYGFGLAAIENMRTPQAGFATLAFKTDYDVVRLYSLSENDAFTMSPAAIADRFLLAAKDRNIRMFYLNTAPMRSASKPTITDSLDNLVAALDGRDGEEGAVAKLERFGFKAGFAEPFDYRYEGWQKVLRAVVALGAIAIIALLLDAFLRGFGPIAFVIGLGGSAGLFVLSPSLLEQALALGAAVAAPTLAVIWSLGRVRAHTEGDRRPVGGFGDADPAGADDERLFGGRWLFDGHPAGRRLVSAVFLFAVTSLLSLCGTAFVFGLLTNVTYSLVLQQFRGVSVLHMAPIALVALYVFLYTGRSVSGQLRKLLRLKVTVLGVVVAAVLAGVGYYYMTRTGNSGQVTSIEIAFRNFLESTFGVRPRTKEFLLAHPLFVLGLFLSFRYRAAWVLMIAGVLGQLSMVDTFAHIHSPILLSLIRCLLGLGLGLIIGLILIALWQLGEGAWRRWALSAKGKRRSA